MRSGGEYIEAVGSMLLQWVSNSQYELLFVPRTLYTIVQVHIYTSSLHLSLPSSLLPLSLPPPPPPLPLLSPPSLPLSLLTLQSETLLPYADYCPNMVVAKSTLEARKQEPGVEDFLQVCLCVYVWKVDAIVS